MPATRRRKAADRFVLGVDGCRAGWVAARLNLKTGALTSFVAPRFGDILSRDGAHAETIMVDMPIGLAESGGRFCETAARGLLKPLRHSSVFSAPRRPMLDFETYEEANRWGKAQAAHGGLSKQAWMIAPKIKEIDAVITPADQARLGEAHPEVAFWRLNGERPCAFPKRQSEGQEERRRLLKRHGASGADKIYQRLKTEFKSGIGLDDVFDACALALTAKARLDGDAVHLTNGARDARRLVMEIWG